MRRFILLAMVAAMALTVLARPAMAETKTPFTAMESDEIVLDYGTSWFSHHWEFHVRGFVDQLVLTGDLEGTVVNVANADFLPGQSDVWGTMVITTSDTTYEGSFRGVDQTGGGSFSGTFVAHGSDGTELIQSSFTPVEGGVLLQGIILDPNG